MSNEGCDQPMLATACGCAKVSQSEIIDATPEAKRKLFDKIVAMTKADKIKFRMDQWGRINFFAGFSISESGQQRWMEINVTTNLLNINNGNNITIAFASDLTENLYQLAKDNALRNRDWWAEQALAELEKV